MLVIKTDNEDNYCNDFLLAKHVKEGIRNTNLELSNPMCLTWGEVITNQSLYLHTTTLMRIKQESDRQKKAYKQGKNLQKSGYKYIIKKS